MDPLTDLLLRPSSLYLMGAVWVVMETAGRMLPPKVTANQVYLRVLPLVPILLCSAAVWIPGIISDPLSPSSRVLVGIILGWGAGQVHKIFMQTVLGRDPRMAGDSGVPQASLAQVIPQQTLQSQQSIQAPPPGDRGKP
jgi:hypothetical protein